MRRNFLQDARERQGVAVVGVVEKEPGPGRADNEQEHAPVTEELTKGHTPGVPSDTVAGLDRPPGEQMELLGGTVRLALDPGLETGGLGHLGPQVDHGCRGQCAKAK